MTINPNQIIALLVAAMVGNALIFAFWRKPSTEKSHYSKFYVGLLLVLLPLAIFYAAWEMCWNRSEDIMLALLLFLPMQAVFATWAFFRYHRRCGRAAGWLRVICGNLLILLVLITSTLAVGEVYYRFLYDTTDSFGYTKVAVRWIKRHYHYNKSKLRDNIEYEKKIQPGKHRITFLGDSFTAGHGIKDVEDRFANRLRRLHPEWEIHAVGGNGMDTGAELGTLKVRTGLGYQVDQVVLVYCLNDVNDLLMDWGPVLETAGGTDRGRLPFYDDSYFLDFLYHRLVIARLPWVKDYFSFVKDAYRGEQWKIQQERLRDLRAVVESHHGELSVVTFPFLHALGPNYEYQFVHDALNDFWREEGVPHLDLLPLFKDYQPARVTVNAFDAHPNEFANQLAAERISTFLIEQVKTNAPSTSASNQTSFNPQSR